MGEIINLKSDVEPSRLIITAGGIKCWERETYWKYSHSRRQARKGEIKPERGEKETRRQKASKGERGGEGAVTAGRKV